MSESIQQGINGSAKIPTVSRMFIRINPAGKRKGKIMEPSIRLKKTTLLLMALLIVCLGLSAKVQAASPPHGGYPTFNTAEGQNALSNPAGGGWNLAPSPNTGSPNNYFFGVAAITPNNVWAVGGYGIQGDQA
jgi:hypothetical protein